MRAGRRTCATVRHGVVRQDFILSTCGQVENLSHHGGDWAGDPFDKLRTGVGPPLQWQRRKDLFRQVRDDAALSLIQLRIVFVGHHCGYG